MNEIKLNTFLTIVEVGSFSRCAELMGTKQSTISTRVTQLEKDLGVSLFQRGRSGASLTRAGLQFESHCKSLLSIWGQVKRELSPSLKQNSDRVHLSVQCNLCRISLISWVNAIGKTLNDANLNIELTCAEQVVRRINKGQTDIGIVLTPEYHPDIEIKEIHKTRFSMVSNHTSALNSVTNSDYIFNNFSSRFRSLHMELLPQLSRARYYVDSYEVGIELLKRSRGSVYIPELIALDLCRRNKCIVIVEDSPVIELPVYSVTQARRTRDRNLARVLSTINSTNSIADPID